MRMFCPSFKKNSAIPTFRYGTVFYAVLAALLPCSLTFICFHLPELYLAKIKVPTLLVWGSEDTATPLEDGKTMESVLKYNGVDTALIVFKGRGHFAYAEEPQRFVAICKSFI